MRCPRLEPELAFSEGNCSSQGCWAPSWLLPCPLRCERPLTSAPRPSHSPHVAGARPAPRGLSRARASGESQPHTPQRRPWAAPSLGHPVPGSPCPTGTARGSAPGSERRQCRTRPRAHSGRSLVGAAEAGTAESLRTRPSERESERASGLAGGKRSRSGAASGPAQRAPPTVRPRGG